MPDLWWRKADMIIDQQKFDQLIAEVTWDMLYIYVFIRGGEKLIA